MFSCAPRPAYSQTKTAAAILAAMSDVQKNGLAVAEHLEDEIHEVKADGFRQTFRVLFAAEGKHDQMLLSLEGFSKKTQKTPQAKIRFAKRRLHEWRAARFGRGGTEPPRASAGTRGGATGGRPHPDRGRGCARDVAGAGRPARIRQCGRQALNDLPAGRRPWQDDRVHCHGCQTSGEARQAADRDRPATCGGNCSAHDRQVVNRADRGTERPRAARTYPNRIISPT